MNTQPNDHTEVEEYNLESEESSRYEKPRQSEVEKKLSIKKPGFPSKTAMENETNNQPLAGKASHTPKIVKDKEDMIIQPAP